MPDQEAIALCQYRLSKADSFLHDAEKTLKLEMYENAANRSYYAIFHSVRALLALDKVDFSKHTGVISYFQLTYIKTRLLPVELSNILKSAFSLRTESDYRDFYIIAKEDVIQQVKEARFFYETLKAYVMGRIENSSASPDL